MTTKINSAFFDWKMKSGLIMSVLLLFSIITQAQTTFEEKFELANTLYTQAQYDSAVLIYESILESDLESAALYYNLGNTYFKLRNYPKSILYFEKALKLAPNDNDILENLQIANSRIVDKIEPMPELFFKVWWRNFCNIFHPDTWAILSILALVILLVLVFWFLVSRNHAVRKTTFFFGILFIFVLIGTLAIAAQGRASLKQENQAIIFSPTITVKSAPGISSVDLFILHEGAKVTILDNVSGWNRIRIANGSVGWLPENSMINI